MFPNVSSIPFLHRFICVTTTRGPGGGGTGGRHLGLSNGAGVVVCALIEQDFVHSIYLFHVVLLPKGRFSWQCHGNRSTTVFWSGQVCFGTRFVVWKRAWILGDIYFGGGGGGGETIFYVMFAAHGERRKLYSRLETRRAGFVSISTGSYFFLKNENKGGNIFNHSLRCFSLDLFFFFSFRFLFCEMG